MNYILLRLSIQFKILKVNIDNFFLFTYILSKSMFILLLPTSYKRMCCMFVNFVWYMMTSGCLNTYTIYIYISLWWWWWWWCLLDKVNQNLKLLTFMTNTYFVLDMMSWPFCCCLFVFFFVYFFCYFSKHYSSLEYFREIFSVTGLIISWVLNKQ